MSVNDHYEADTLKILHTITDQVTGGAKSLTGATVLAIIDPPDGETFDGGATIVDAAAGQIAMEFQPDAFEAKTYPYQIRVTDSTGDVQTVVASSITAKRSLRLFSPDETITPAAWGALLSATPAPTFYDTVGDGLAAAADGDYFFVANISAAGHELWRRVDGLPATVRLDTSGA